MADSEWKTAAGNSTGDADVWDKKDPLEGKFTKMEENVGPNNSSLYTIETSDGPVKAWGNAVLNGRFEEIPVGSPVRITYLGLKDSEKGGGRQYHDYKVEYKVLEGADAVSAAFPDATEEPAKEPVDDIPDMGGKEAK